MTGLEMLRKAAIEIDGTKMFGGASVFLRKTAEQIEREQTKDHEIAEWVDKNGGIEGVEDKCWFAESVVEKLEIEGANVHVSELLLSELDKRLMPPGCEWPEVDGKPVEIGERLSGYGSGPDGYEVVGVRPTCGWVLVKAYDNCIIEWDASNCKRPKQDPIGADGLPIKNGETVRGTGRSQHEFEVLDTHDINPEVGSRFSVKCFDKNDDEVCWCDPKLLTHTKPEPTDSWEQLEKDAMLKPFGYVSNVLGWDMRKTHTMNQATHAMTLDIVRRAKALADSDGGYR